MIYEPQGQTQGETALIQATVELTYYTHSNVLYAQRLMLNNTDKIKYYEYNLIFLTKEVGICNVIW